MCYDVRRPVSRASGAERVWLRNLTCPLIVVAASRRGPVMGNSGDLTLLVMELQSSNQAEREAAAFGLHGGTINDGDGTMIVQLLEHRDPGVRQAAAYALQGSTLADSTAAMILGQLLEARDPDVRQAAAYALQGTTILDEQAAQYVAMVQRRL